MVNEGFKRKLTAILSADAVGYSRLMRADEEATVRDIAAHRILIADIIQQHRGRVIDSPGDNMLAEFPSVVDAVNGAIKIQEQIKKSNTDTPEDRRMEFRIGINLGDVIEEEDRIYGDGVNIAARLEGLASTGGIAISGTVYEHIKEKLSLGYHFFGEQDVKNIPEPVRVYRLLTEPDDIGKMIDEKKPKVTKSRWAIYGGIALIILFAGSFAIWNSYYRPSLEPASVEKMAFPLPEEPSIAVLPFDNMSGDPEQGYIADGFTENIITGLSQIPEMFVIARNSVFTYRGKPVKIKQVSEELGVKYVLEGSVQKAGDRLRVNAQLIDAVKGHHLWAERYDRELKDLFKLQDEITIKILSTLHVKLITGGDDIIWWRTDSFEAWGHNVQGWNYFDKYTRQDNLKAREHHEQAIKLDPDYGAAWELLAWTYIADVWLGSSDSPEESIKRALEIAKRTSERWGKGGLHFFMAEIYLFQRQFEKAIAEGEKAVAIAPNSSRYHIGLAAALNRGARPEEAIVHAKKAMRLEPYYPAWFLGNVLALAYDQAGRHEEALEIYEKLIERALKGEYPLKNLYRRLAGSYALLDRMEEARDYAAKFREIDPTFSLEKWRKSRLWMFKNQKWLNSAVEMMRKAGLPYTPPLQAPDKPTIAVLPFVNMSGDPEQEYFSDGLTDELIGDLAKISGILVISRNSAFTYKGKQVKIAQIAKELNVRYVLEGSVQKSGDKVRIRAQLIDGETDHHLWSESYDGVLKDIFDLQDKITGKIVSALAVKLSPSEQERVADKGTDNVLAYEAFLKGKEHFLKSTLEDFLKAIEYYKQAIKFDPNFSRAYAAIGETYQIGSNLGWGSKMGGGRETIKLLARNYLELAMKNPSPEAYSLAAAIELHRRNFQKSITFAEKAYNYAPNSTDRLTSLAWKLAFTDRTENSIELLNKAIRLDPLDTQKDTPISFIFIGVNHFSMGNLEEAITYLEKGLSINPKLNNFSCFLAASHALLGNDIEAKKALAEYLKIFPQGFPVTIQLLYYAWPFKDSNVFDRFAQGLVKAGLQGDSTNYYKLREENKLSGQEIRELLFGKTSSGYVWGIKALKYSYDISDEGEVEYKFKGKTYTGKAWIEDENICLLREQYHGGLKSCEAIYRNPEGDELTKTEYFRVTDYGLFLFAIKK